MFIKICIFYIVSEMRFAELRTTLRWLTSLIEIINNCHEGNIRTSECISPPQWKMISLRSELRLQAGCTHTTIIAQMGLVNMFWSSCPKHRFLLYNLDKRLVFGTTCFDRLWWWFWYKCMLTATCLSGCRHKWRLCNYIRIKQDLRWPCTR